MKSERPPTAKNGDAPLVRTPSPAPCPCERRVRQYPHAESRRLGVWVPARPHPHGKFGPQATKGVHAHKFEASSAPLVRSLLCAHDQSITLPLYDVQGDAHVSLLTRMRHACRCFTKLCTSTYLTALCHMQEHLRWQPRQKSPPALGTAHGSPSRSATLRTSRIVIFIIVIVFGCNRIPPSHYTYRSPPPPRRRQLRLFRSSQHVHQPENRSLNPDGQYAAALRPPVHSDP